MKLHGLPPTGASPDFLAMWNSRESMSMTWLDIVGVSRILSASLEASVIPYYPDFIKALYQQASGSGAPGGRFPGLAQAEGADRTRHGRQRPRCLRRIAARRRLSGDAQDRALGPACPPARGMSVSGAPAGVHAKRVKIQR